MTNADQPSRLDRIERVLERVAVNQESLQQTVQQNTLAIAALREDLQASFSHLVGIVGDFAEEAHNDREQAERDRSVFQAEIRRIWEYLLRQGGNGNAPPSN
ncbi:hypothetical protein VB735_17060 [Halotia wernerae UHCC 0503]|nr:hypothetical protein [Halotia wernerae UHCC 0503]